MRIDQRVGHVRALQLCAMGSVGPRLEDRQRLGDQIRPDCLSPGFKHVGKVTRKMGNIRSTGAHESDVVTLENRLLATHQGMCSTGLGYCRSTAA